MAQPMPSQPVMVLPWLQQPLTTLLWPALALSTLVLVVGVIRTTRSPDRFPFSTRWTAIAAILCCALFAALAYGANLTHPAALYTTPVLILISTLLARNAWHASDENQHHRSRALPLAAASMFVTGSLLLFEKTGASTRTHPHGLWDVGLGWGEAVAFLLPAIGAVLAPLALLPADHPRTAAVRRATVLLIASLITVTAATVAAGAVAMTAPFPPPPAAPSLADRYIYLNAILPLPPLLATLCAFAVFLAAPRRSWAVRTIILLLAAAAAFPLVSHLERLYGQRTVFDFDSSGPAVSLAAGLTLGALLVPISRFSLIFRAAVLIALLLAWGAIFETLPNPAHSPLTSTLNRTIALIGLLAGATLPAARTAVPQTPLREPLAAAVITLCLLAGSFTARTLELRSQLTYQATRFSQAFKYESLPNTTPEMRRELQGLPHGLHMSPDGFRWAWVTPHAIWWTRDDAWRDAVIITDHTQPRVTDPAATGAFYGAKITEPDRVKLSDISFTDAKYIAIVQPSPPGQKKLIVHGIAARQATPSQLLAFARFDVTNPRTWLGFALGVPLAMLLSRRGTSIAAAAALSAALLVIVAASLGLAGSIALLIGTGVVLTSASLRRDDRWHAPAMLAVLMGVALGLGGLLLRLNDLA